MNRDEYANELREQGYNEECIEYFTSKEFISLSEDDRVVAIIKACDEYGYPKYNPDYYPCCTLPATFIKTNVSIIHNGVCEHFECENLDIKNSYCIMFNKHLRKTRDGFSYRCYLCKETNKTVFNG